jgi:hypothetical protein
MMEMIDLIIDLAMIILLSFIILQSLVSLVRSIRGFIYHNQNREQSGLHKEAAGKSTW